MPFFWPSIGLSCNINVEVSSLGMPSGKASQVRFPMRLCRCLQNRQKCQFPPESHKRGSLSLSINRLLKPCGFYEKRNILVRIWWLRAFERISNWHQKYTLIFTTASALCCLEPRPRWRMGLAIKNLLADMVGGRLSPQQCGWGNELVTFQVHRHQRKRSDHIR